MPLSGSRTEFLAADTLGPAGDIQYGRSGGWFVTTRKALVLGLAVIAGVVIIALLIHYLDTCKQERSLPIPGPSSNNGSTTEGSTTVSSYSTTVPPPLTTVQPLPEVNYRLSPSLIPRHYNITIQTFIGEDKSNFTFKGHVSILIVCTKPNGDCSEITLHAKDLDVNFDGIIVSQVDVESTRNERAVPKKFGGSQKQENSVVSDEVVFTSTSLLKVVNKSEDKEKDTVTLQVEPSLKPGLNYTLDISFMGNLTKGLSGFYRSSYTDSDKVKKWLATTHFEATHARKAFPCFDEPAMKARFELHLARHGNLTTVSNMPRGSTQPVAGQPGWFWDHYPPSPIMSTYLVAFTVSEFVSLNITSKRENDTAFGVIARREVLPQAQYSLDIGHRILNYYTEYFRVPYPLPKMDMAAIPDFAAGAMENWGLVTYRESRMLFNPNISTTGTQQSVAIVVAHELAHQWFGNLVTMDWWSDLWLNEGFATYVSYIGTNNVEPTWGMLDRIVTHQLHPVLETDSLNSTHPISVTVNNPGQISEAFDDVSYSKGACLIRMLNHSLTEKVFRDGLKEYLNTWQYRNAKQDDLWASLTTAANKEKGLLPAGKVVKDVMDTWTLLEGYPVVTVERDYDGGSMMLTQRRFRLEHAPEGTVKSGKDSPLWFIPISYTTGEEMAVADTRPRVWMSGASLNVSNVTKPRSNSWVLLNLQDTGYYRVHYDHKNWLLLIEHLYSSRTDSLPVTTRAQLINDAMNLARAGLLPYTTAMNLTRYLPGREINLLPWSAFFDSIRFLEGMLRNSKVYGALQDFIVEQTTPLFKTLGESVRENDTQPQKLLRALLIGKLLKAESPNMMMWAQTLFNQWMNTTDPDTSNPIPLDFRGEVYCAAVKAGGNREWRFVYKRFEAADTNPSEAQNLLRSLMCTRNTWLINSLLERSLEDGSSIRLQDSIYVWRTVGRNPVASALAFGYLRSKWDDIFKRYGKIGFVQRAVLIGSTSGLNTQQDLRDLISFRDSHADQFNLTTRTLAQCIERLQLKVFWQSKYQSVLTEWFNSYKNLSVFP